VNEKKKDPLLQKLGAAAAAAAAAASSAAPPGSGDGSAMTPRHDRRDCTDAELLSALRKIRAAEAEAAERGGGGGGGGEGAAAAPAGCKKIREIGARADWSGRDCWPLFGFLLFQSS
jgi:hypothetical protein